MEDEKFVIINLKIELEIFGNEVELERSKMVDVFLIIGFFEEVLMKAENSFFVL